MKILFVCWANVSRSQMAAAFYNQLTGSTDADAAGTEVGISGETLGDRRKRLGGTRVIDIMQEEDINMTDKVQTQLFEEMLDKYDKVISMADHQYTPEWLRNHPRFVYWHVDDPGGKDLDAARIAKNTIKTKVQDFIKSTAQV
ncbi:MAG: isoleucyl-tRNA synthetase [Patescibacteria group bacterium]|nr:isoleucyl-tRNA synthetase [Patescibacteria group bacterium]